MPLGLLRAADQRLQLREQLVDDAEVQRQREADRRPRREQQLFDLAPDRVRPADRRAECARQISARLVVERRSKRAANCTRPQHPQAVVGETCRDRRRAARVARDRARPSNGSRYSSVSGSHEMALTVKSRRRAASSIGHRRIAGDREAAVAAARLRLAPRQRDVDVADLVDLKALADRFDAAEWLRAAPAARSAGSPNTSRSMSFDSRPSSRSRTQPPTISARPPALADGARDVARLRRQCAAHRDRLAPPSLHEPIGKPGAIAFEDAEPGARLRSG